jgi:hypothetical protein
LEGVVGPLEGVVLAVEGYVEGWAAVVWDLE